MSDKYNRYINRTVSHIHRVQKNMAKVVTEFKEELGLSQQQCRILMYNVMKHDRSKFSESQFEPYIELTEYYHQKKVLGNREYDYFNKDIKKLVDEAVQDHYCQENHHPERLKINGPSDQYSFYQAIETVCDLQAMSQEFNEGTCRKFFEEVWKKKQCKNFYDDYNWFSTIEVMDSVICCFEKRRE